VRRHKKVAVNLQEIGRKMIVSFPRVCGCGMGTNGFVQEKLLGVLMGRSKKKGKEASADKGEPREVSTTDGNSQGEAVEVKSLDELKHILHSATHSDLILVDVFAQWCSPCKRMKGFIQELARKDRGICLVKVDADKVEDAALVLGVTAMPTFIAFKGQTEVGRLVGADREAVNALVAKLHEA
jgi:thioredoxin 1